MMARHPKFHSPGIALSGLEKLFGELLGTVGAVDGVGAVVPAAKSALTGRAAAPAVDLYEEETQYVVEAAVPGLSGEQLTIEFEDGVLTLAGEWATDSEERRAQSVRRERARGAFKRELRFADRVDPDGLTADLADGVLTVRLPKAAAAQRRRIDIGTN